MVCPACGTPNTAEGRFCQKCGALIQAPPVPPPPGGFIRPPAYLFRVQRNLQTLGILWCIFGAYRLLAGLAGMFFLRAASMRRFSIDGWPNVGPFAHAPEWMAGLIPFLAMYTIVVATLAVIVGYSLLTRRPWGRTLAIVAAVLALFKPLLGTGLGIYTLWVLAPTESAVEFDALAARP